MTCVMKQKFILLPQT